jgi:hypothetical protein
MPWHAGSCHCGQIRFEVEGPIERVVQCNCSICAKKGALHHAVAATGFRLLSGQDQLATYRFGTGEARHHFCRSCGIHVFARPRGAPELFSVNVRTLDDFDLQHDAPEVVAFDGRHWDEAMDRIRRDRG